MRLSSRGWKSGLCYHVATQRSGQRVLTDYGLLSRSYCMLVQVSGWELEFQQWCLCTHQIGAVLGHKEEYEFVAGGTYLANSLLLRAALRKATPCVRDPPYIE